MADRTGVVGRVLQVGSGAASVHDERSDGSMGWGGDAANLLTANLFDAITAILNGRITASSGFGSGGVIGPGVRVRWLQMPDWSNRRSRRLLLTTSALDNATAAPVTIGTERIEPFARGEVLDAAAFV